MRDLGIRQLVAIIDVWSNGPDRQGPQGLTPLARFSPLEAPSHDAHSNKIKGKERGAAKKRALTARALTDLDCRLAMPHETLEECGSHR